MNKREDCHIKVSRYDPDEDQAPALKEYRVPYIEQGTVLEALLHIYEEVDSTLLFHYGCRSGICGKCAVRINGKTALACKTPLEDGMVVQPLDNLPVIRDLAVDRAGLLDTLREKEILLSPGKETEKVLQPPEYFNLIRCIECLSCLSNCPVVGAGEEEGAPLFGVKAAELCYDARDSKDRTNLLKAFYTCTTCGACTEFCSSEIDLQGIIGAMRKRAFAAGAFPGPLLKLEAPVLNMGNIYGATGEDRTAVFPREIRERFEKGAYGETAETLLFMGCVPSYLDMRIVPSLLQILESAKVDYTLLGKEEKCCGFPLYLMGAESFETQARKVIGRIRDTGARELVTPCAGCYKAFKRVYPLFGDPGVEVYHTVQYLNKLIDKKHLKLKGELRKRVTYHDPCDLGRGFGIFEEPRGILKGIKGLEYREMKRNRRNVRCCGGGGDVQVHNPELAVAMAVQRVRDALEVGAEIIVSGCAACKDNLKKGVRALPKQERGKLKVMDITEIVAKTTVAE